MASKLLGKAIHSLSLRKSKLFLDCPNLAEAILVAISHQVYILYDRGISNYYFIALSPNSYQILSILQTNNMLDLDKLVPIVERLLKKEITNA
jgi:uncharacterized linocin/CFP29 family protein